MENKDKRIPKYCFEIPLSGVDYIYKSSFSHSPVVVMKPLVQPLERISEETKKLRCMKCGRVAKNGESLNSNKNGTFIECDDCMWNVEPLQNGERDFRDLCSYRLDGELWIYSEKELKHGGGSFVEWVEKHGTKLSDLLSQSKKEGEEKEKAETKKKIEELFHFYIPHGLYTVSESSWMYTQFGEAIVEEFLRNKEKLV